MATARTVFKRVAIGAAAVIGLLVILAVAVPAFLPSHIHVERSGQIDKSPEEVFAVVSDLNQYRRWDPFSDTDPTAKATVTGEGVGQLYEWEGEKIGRGSMTLASLDPPRRVTVQMQILEPMNDSSRRAGFSSPRARERGSPGRSTRTPATWSGGWGR